MRLSQILQEENHLPKLDKYLASSVIDAAIGFGFDLSDMAAPSSFDDHEESQDETERLADNILASIHNTWMNQIQPAIKGRNMNVYRAISVPSIHLLKTESLGKHWATDAESAYPYWGKQKIWIVLHALVDLKYIDWSDTFALHIEGHENEVRLYTGTPVKIVGLEWKSHRGKGGHLDDEGLSQQLIGKTFTT